MIDRDQVVRETLAQLPRARLQRRELALAKVSSLLALKLGTLDEDDLRRALELFNQDVNHGKDVQGRFAGGLVGRNANLLVSSLGNVNELVPKLWRADDEWLTANLARLRWGRQLPGGGWLFLTMVLHARDPQRFLPGSYTLLQGLAAIEGVPMSKFKSGADYLEYCRRVNLLLAAYKIPQYGADVLLFNGFRLGQASGEVEAGDDELEEPPVIDRDPADIDVLGLTTPSIGKKTPAAPPPTPTSVRVTAPTPAPVADTRTSFGWLHLTDLHQGMSGASWLWPNLKAQLYADLEKLHANSGPWDVVFFTGDLTQRGTREEFDQLDKTLEQLWARLDRFGSRPQLIPVPGNHDLERPGDRFDPVVVALRQWHLDRHLRNHVWNGPDNPYRARLRQAFATYSEWLSRGRWLSAPRLEGALPGDLAVSLSVGSMKVGVIGLNSAFLQLTDGDCHERLDVSPHQLHEVCGHDAPDWLMQHHVNFLLTHHPPEWLEPRARQEFNNEIDVPGRFAAHLYGHMHEGTSTSISLGGGALRHALQGASLFGLEDYGAPGGHRVQRIHGYSAGRIELTSAAATTARLQLFPRRMIDNKLGRRIERDQDNYVLDDRGAISWDVPISRRGA